MTTSLTMKNLILALCGFLVLATPLAATAQQFGDFTYTTSGSAITITGYNGPSGEVTIPSTINGLPVTRIGDYVFNSVYYSLTAITIPDSVTSIGVGAFSPCYALRSLALPTNLTSIGDSAFQGCGSLGSVTIPGTLTNIGSSVFKILRKPDQRHDPRGRHPPGG